MVINTRDRVDVLKLTIQTNKIATFKDKTLYTTSKTISDGWIVLKLCVVFFILTRFTRSPIMQERNVFDPLRKVSLMSRIHPIIYNE